METQKQVATNHVPPKRTKVKDGLPFRGKKVRVKTVNHYRTVIWDMMEIQQIDLEVVAESDGFKTYGKK